MKLNMPETPEDKKKIKRHFLFVVLPSFLACFAWFYLSVHGGMLKSIAFGLSIAATLTAIFRLYKLRLDKKQSGLSNDNYLLKQSGGANGLLNDASLVHAIGWVCIIVPILLVLFCLIAGNRQAAVIAGIVSGTIGIPSALACFLVAARTRRVAKNAGAKIW